MRNGDVLVREKEKRLGLEDTRRVEFATAPIAITRLIFKLTQSNLSLLIISSEFYFTQNYSEIIFKT